MYELLQQIFSGTVSDTSALQTHLGSGLSDINSAVRELGTSKNSQNYAALTRELRAFIRTQRQTLGNIFEHYQTLLQFQQQIVAQVSALKKPVATVAVTQARNKIIDKTTPLSRAFFDTQIKPACYIEDDNFLGINTSRQANLLEQFPNTVAFAICQTLKAENRLTKISQLNPIATQFKFTDAQKTTLEAGLEADDLEEPEVHIMDALDLSRRAIPFIKQAMANNEFDESYCQQAKDAFFISTEEWDADTDNPSPQAAAESGETFELDTDTKFDDLSRKDFLRAIDGLSNIAQAYANHSDDSSATLNVDALKDWQELDLGSAIAFLETANDLAKKVSTQTEAMRETLTQALEETLKPLAAVTPVAASDPSTPYSIQLLKIMTNPHASGWPSTPALAPGALETPLDLAQLAKTRITADDFLTAVHGEIGRLAYTNLCQGQAVPMAYVQLACQEQASLTQADTMIIPEAELRRILYSTISLANAGSTQKKAVHLLSELAPPNDTPTTEKLARQHEQRLWKDYLTTITANPINKTDSKQALFHLDLLLAGEVKDRGTQTSFLGYSSTMMQVFARVCSCELQAALFQLSLEAETAVAAGNPPNYEQKLKEWISHLKPDQESDPFSAADSDSGSTRSVSTHFHITEIQLLKILWVINESFNDHGTLTNPATLTDSLASLLDVASAHKASDDGLERLFACRAAWEYLDVIYDMTCKNQSALIDENGNVVRTSGWSSSFKKPSFKQSYLHIRNQLQQLQFMIQGDINTNKADPYTWRRAKLADDLQTKYQTLLVNVVNKASESKDPTHLANQLLGWFDLKHFCTAHQQGMPEYQLDEAVQTLAEKLESYHEQFNTEFTQDGHVETSKEKLEADETIPKEYRDSFYIALQESLTGQARVAYESQTTLSFS